MRDSANKKHLIDYRQNVKRCFVCRVALVYLHLGHMMANVPLELIHFKRVKGFLVLSHISCKDYNLVSIYHEYTISTALWIIRAVDSPN